MAKMIVAIVIWTVLFWVVCAIGALIYRLVRRNLCRKELESASRVIAWENIKNSPDAGVIWLDESNKYFHGLLLWWIPTDQNVVDSDLLFKWQESGLLIDNQELDVTTISASGHRIEDYDER